MGTLATIGTWLAGGPFDWVAAGALLGSVVPYTLLVILPTNTRLLDKALSPDSPEARRLLGRWGALHAVRTLAGLGAAAAMAHLLARG